MEAVEEPTPDGDPGEAALRMATEGLKRARDAGGRVAADIAAAGPAVVLNNLRGLKAALDAATADPVVVDRLSRGAYHLAGLLDACGVLPVAAAGAVAEALASYAGEPDEEG